MKFILLFMATIASGIICAWPSTAASIPSGWTRETGLDAKYIQGAAASADADLVSSFGSATHTHTSPSHTPTQNSHTHSFSSGANNNQVRRDDTPADLNIATAHSHASATSSSATGTNNGIAITVDATSNDLAFIKVIFIKSNGTPTGFPVNSYAFFSSDTLPSLWSRVQGNTYLKGADASGDGGGTGGANTHTHTSPAHTHTQNAHNHANTTSSVSSANSAMNLGDESTSHADDLHTHSVSFANTTPTNQAVTTTIDSANHEPVFKKLNIINNGNAGVSFPDQIIALWGGANASIPTDWARFTSMDGNFVKGANADGESNVTTGGAATHTHTASNCQPIQNAHTHTSSGANGASVLGDGVIFRSGGVQVPIGSHAHAWTTVNQTPTNQSTAVSINANISESAYPVYAKVIFIQWTEPAGAVVVKNLTILGVGP